VRGRGCADERVVPPHPPGRAQRRERRPRDRVGVVGRRHDEDADLLQAPPALGIRCGGHLRDARRSGQELQAPRRREPVDELEQAGSSATASKIIESIRQRRAGIVPRGDPRDRSAETAP
jgi:hypothetical protein